MGLRGEIFSTKVTLQNRTYFFNVKENRLGDLYLNIVESKNKDEGGFDRQSVILFAEDLQAFLQGFDESLKVMEKEVRDKRRARPPRETNKREAPRREGSGPRREGPQKTRIKVGPKGAPRGGEKKAPYPAKPRLGTKPGNDSKPRRDKGPGKNKMVVKRKRTD
ncbi:MAG: DUF3276 family protein [Treponema sp.]|nr:DUF3276 family protein [Treponema sp.]